MIYLELQAELTGEGLSLLKQAWEPGSRDRVLRRADADKGINRPSYLPQQQLELDMEPWTD